MEAMSRPAFFSNLRSPPMTSRYSNGSACLALMLCGAAMWAAWFSMASTDGGPRGANAAHLAKSPEKLSAEGLENLWELPLPDGRILLSGGQPQGATGFQSLKALGVRTVISVDGARPEVETAREAGLRYVHLPIGYDDVPVERRLALIQAIRELPGTVYVHCHHGKHRGPSAAVCAWRGLNPGISAEQGGQTIREMGTAEKYRGLYKAVAEPPLRAKRVMSQPADFPEVTAVRPLAADMVAINHDWETLQRFSKAKSWTPEEAREIMETQTVLAERFRESARLLASETGAAYDDLRRLLVEFSDAVHPLDGDDDADRRATGFQSTMQQLEQRCAACHARYRD